jgi:actin-related protein
MENAEDEGEEKEQWLAVETTEVGGELLSTVHMQREQWIMQKAKEKMKGKRAMAGAVS